MARKGRPEQAVLSRRRVGRKLERGFRELVMFEKSRRIFRKSYRISGKSIYTFRRYFYGLRVYTNYPRKSIQVV